MREIPREVSVSKQVSPTFAAIVILLALALGALYFLYRYRAHEIQWKREAAALQAQAEMARKSGRSMAGGRRPMRQQRAPGAQRRPAPGTGRAAAPSAAPSKPAAAGKQAPATK